MARSMAGIAGLLLACAGLQAAPAAAQVHGELAATNIHYTLVDLTPEDGEAPWVRFTSADWNPIVWSASIAPDAAGPQSAQFSDERHFAFELSPHTRLSFVYDTHFAFHAPQTDPRQFAIGELYSHVDYGWGGGKGRTDYAFNSLDDDAHVGQTEWTWGTDYTRDNMGGMGFSTEYDVATGTYDIRASASLYADAAAPVPEAPVPAMLAVGLGLVGLLGRRARRQG